MTERDVAFRRKQGVVVGLGLLAAGVVAAVGRGAPAWFADLVPPADDLATRLTFAVRWLARIRHGDDDAADDRGLRLVAGKRPRALSARKACCHVPTTWPCSSAPVLDRPPKSSHFDGLAAIPRMSKDG
jgi:hypothetical protein